MSTVPLDVSKSATFAADGTATLDMGPQVYGHEWNIRRMVVNTTSALSSEVRVYLGAVTDSRLVAGSYSGNRDFNETDITLQTLDKLIVRWTGGTPGATATFQVQGRTLARGRV